MQKSKPAVQSTLSFLIKDNKVLLAQKKRGFGVGKWNGVGGKKNSDETIEQTAKRETERRLK
jgi:ADP-ribose pyrophosphatase YjhB (NUDIX family)